MGRDRRRAGGDAAHPPRRPMLPFEIEEEVDLHGLAVDEAMVAAEQALKRHAARRGAVLRFVHGHSSGASGSIKGELKRRLETVWRNRIQAFRPEPGNPGATLVKLANP